MKLSLVLLVLFVCPALSTTQSEEHDLRTLLQDSAYVFNRFDEVTTGLDTQIDDWNVPATTKVLFKASLSGTLQVVEAEKPTLNELLLKNEVSSTELFDVYSKVKDVASDLEGRATDVSNWGDSAKAMELAELGYKANILAANIEVVLRIKLETQEAQVKLCSKRSSSPATKHK
jgi:hypothetical protein